MKHTTTSRFWRLYDDLPVEIQQLADTNHKLLEADLHHPSLDFKRVKRFWSVRVGLHYRALGIDTDDGIAWIWIGPHAEYDHLVG